MTPFSKRTGVGEIRAKGREGLIYEAPVLIIHYIEAHGYRPPASFLDALDER
jgi:hypothetical protein